MAQVEEKWLENREGRFFVDAQCIDCDVCREMAPDYFRRNDEEEHSYVYKQPESEQGVYECREALENCPVEAIGDLRQE
jgi:ferredoxin